jgi:hypothetical protein
MLRWRRLGSFVACSFLLLNVKALVTCNPRTLIIGFCTYVNIFSSYEVLCCLSEIVSPFLSFVVDARP